MRHPFPAITPHPFLQRGATDAFCVARPPLLFGPTLYNRFVTLNEGRRAVLLSDNDPLSLRAPIVGVWVSGGDNGGGTGGVGTPSGQQQQQQSGRRPSPLNHPYVYPACLRFLLGFRGGGGASKATTAAAAAASPAAFLVMQLPGGVGGGKPACYEACAVSAAATPTAGGARGIRVSSVGFEQLDFSADVDVSVGGRGRQGGVAGGGASSANRAVVIARLRRVSALTAAGGAFGRALARTRGRCGEIFFLTGRQKAVFVLNCAFSSVFFAQVVCANTAHHYRIYCSGGHTPRVRRYARMAECGG